MESPSFQSIVNQLKPRPPKPDDPTRGPGQNAQHLGDWSVPAHPPGAHQKHESAPSQGRQAADEPSVQLRIPFETGSDRLTPAAAKALDTLGRALSSPGLARYRFRIEGHTDSAGSSALNAALSARRADAVMDYIVSHFGVDRLRLTAVGLGDSQMIVTIAARCAGIT